MTEQTKTEQTKTDGTLLPENENEQLTTRWKEIQASFVDKPQESVEEADALVADLMDRVTYGLATERKRLEKQWAAGDDVSTEDLRVALKRYRTFFDRLLKA
jgi:glutathione S-transferase